MKTEMKSNSLSNQEPRSPLVSDEGILPQVSIPSLAITPVLTGPRVFTRSEENPGHARREFKRDEPVVAAPVGMGSRYFILPAFSQALSVPERDCEITAFEAPVIPIDVPQEASDGFGSLTTLLECISTVSANHEVRPQSHA